MFSTALVCSLLALFNMARGDDKISHREWLLLSAWIIFSHTLDPFKTILWMCVVVVVSIRATGPTLLIGINGDSKAIWKGFVRNLPILPALWFLHSWAGLILMLQGLLYWLCGKWKDHRATRLAEGLTGVLLGCV